MINPISGSGSVVATGEAAPAPETNRRTEREERARRPDTGAAIVTISPEAASRAEAPPAVTTTAATTAAAQSAREEEPPVDRAQAQVAESASLSSAPARAPASAPVESPALALAAAAAQAATSKSIPKTYEVADVNQDDQVSVNERARFAEREAAQKAAQQENIQPTSANQAAVKAYQQIDQFSRSS